MPPCDWLIAIILLGQRLKLQTCLQTLSMYARNYNETVKNATEMENTESKLHYHLASN